MENKSKLKNLIKHHLDNPENEWVDIEVDGEVVYQYAQGLHNITLLDDSTFDKLLSLLEEKDLEVQQSVREEGWLTFMGFQELETDFELIQEIFSLRDISFQEIEEAKDIQGGDEVSWNKV